MLIDHIISTAAWAKNPKYSKVEKLQNEKSSLFYLIKVLSRKLLKFTGRAEILALIYSLGLIFNIEYIILLSLSTIMLYRFTLMFIIKYKNYLNNIK